MTKPRKAKNTKPCEQKTESQDQTRIDPNMLLDMLAEETEQAKIAKDERKSQKRTVRTKPRKPKKPKSNKRQTECQDQARIDPEQLLASLKAEPIQLTIYEEQIFLLKATVEEKLREFDFMEVLPFNASYKLPGALPLESIISQAESFFLHDGPKELRDKLAIEARKFGHKLKTIGLPQAIISVDDESGEVALDIFLECINLRHE